MGNGIEDLCPEDFGCGDCFLGERDALDVDVASADAEDDLTGMRVTAAFSS